MMSRVGITVRRFCGLRPGSDAESVHCQRTVRQQGRTEAPDSLHHEFQTGKSENVAERSVGTVCRSVYHNFQLPVLSAFSSDRGDVYRPEDSMTVIDHDFSRYFSDMPGCAVIYDQEADRYEVYDRRKAFQRVSPCSTYKIYSGLNALEEGLISPDHSVIPWNGTKYAFSSWNQSRTCPPPCSDR